MKKDDERKKVLTVEEKNAQGNSLNDYLDTYFPVVRASSISIHDEFLKHEPETSKQKKFKDSLISAIKIGLTDFRAQRMDPSLDENGKIYYQAGKMPAGDKSAKWWIDNAKAFIPEKTSRLGTTNERIAFLGLLIKYLVEEKVYTLTEAWRVVCDQSKELGHYYDSEDAKHELEATGSRRIGEWYDLSNTCKIMFNNKKTYASLACGSFKINGDLYPLSFISNFLDPYATFSNFVGWIVMDV